MSNRMISPLEVEKKMSNFWRFFDLKPLFIACVLIYLSGTALVCFGFLRQTSELPVWLSSVIGPFNYHISNNIWAGMGIDWHGQNYTKAEREILKFLCGMNFSVIVIYSIFAIIHASMYTTSSLGMIWKFCKENNKAAVSAVFMYSLLSFNVFDSSLLTAYMARRGGVVSILYPLLFNFTSSWIVLLSTSLFRRILVAHGQKQLAAKQGKD